MTLNERVGGMEKENNRLLLATSRDRSYLVQAEIKYLFMQLVNGGTMDEFKKVLDECTGRPGPVNESCTFLNKSMVLPFTSYINRFLLLIAHRVNYYVDSS